MACHSARIGLLKALALPSSDKRTNAIKQSVSFCLSFPQPILDVSGMMSKFAIFIDRNELIKQALVGISKCNTISSKTAKQVENWHKSMESPVDSEYLKNFATILAFHGLKEESSYLIPLFKTSICNESALLIRLFRKIKNERKFIWSLYVGIKASPDPVSLTDAIATAVAANGWFDRVELVLNRKDNSFDLKPDTAAKLIRGLSHHQLDPEFTNLVFRIFSNTSNEVVVREAIVSFYLVNNQLEALEEGLRLMGPIKSSVLANQVLKKAACIDSCKLFFKFLVLFKSFALNEKSYSLGINLAINNKSSRLLLQVLDAVFIHRARLNPVDEARIRSIVEHRLGVSVRVRKRIAAVLDLIEKQNSESDFITS